MKHTGNPGDIEYSIATDFLVNDNATTSAARMLVYFRREKKSREFISSGFVRAPRHSSSF